ncbi:unnamed protein product, partial [Mesorhabditis belari]|uniref:Uncharacterized protein n=1 Tax=Mesorhabditis belari TaxID=2138241 RepID=A0AAF3FJL7_9BILA
MHGERAQEAKEDFRDYVSARQATEATIELPDISTGAEWVALTEALYALYKTGQPMRRVEWEETVAVYRRGVLINRTTTKKSMIPGKSM